MLRANFIIIGLFMALAGCQTMPTADLSNGGHVYHFVAVSLKDPADSEARERIAEQSEAWKDYPGVISVAHGVGIPGERKVVQNYDYGVLMVFESEAALRAYEQDPTHQEAIRTILAPVASNVQVYDFQTPESPRGGLTREELRKRQYQHYREMSGD
ncbi:Dabb family protein [Cerasicoccus frondis]|uniref:Dabb family protein n=1 Tax=Cerasicoccus frondis TaxID=490090 RepID=UPI002852C024|nr:Dabb family protein [Cerasicoccus frondis]